MSKQGAILLIDDDRDDRELIEEVLNDVKAEHQVVSFASGEEALDYLKSATGQPFLILSDINMPVMDGIELRRQVNENEALRKKSIPFVFLSTTATNKSVEEAYEMSVQGFFQKPSSVQELGSLLLLICDYWQKCRHPNN